MKPWCRIWTLRVEEGCFYRIVFKIWMWLVEYCCAFTSNLLNLRLWLGFETKKKSIAWWMRLRTIRTIPNSRSPFTIWKYSERIEKKSCKSNRKTDEIARANASKRTTKMMKIMMRSTKNTNEAWRREMIMRSKFGNILGCYWMIFFLWNHGKLCWLLKEGNENGCKVNLQIFYTSNNI